MNLDAKLKPSKRIALGMLADAILVNLAFTRAVLWRLLADSVWQHQPLSAVSVKDLLHFYSSSALLLTALTIGVFYKFGIYTRARSYTKKHKALKLFQAITISYLIFVFLLYFSWRRAFAAQGVWIIVASYCATLLFCGGARLLVSFAAARYEIMERNVREGGPLRRVLVVGGAGYIGSLVSRRLLNEGYSVRVLDAAMFGNDAIADLMDHPRFEWLKGDLRQIESLVRAVKDCDAIIHLGAIVGDPACDLNEKTTLAVNTFATKLLLQVAKGYGVRRLLFASTCAVYGASDELMNEQSELNPLSLYARSKVDAEGVLLASHSTDFCPVVLRLGTVFGQSFRPRFDLVVNLLVAKAWQNKKITIYNKKQWRPFVHVDDAARAFVLCLQSDAEVVRGEVFNVGANHLNLTLGQLAEKVRTELPGTEIEYLDTGDARSYRVSFDKIHSNLRFSCEKTVEDGIREIRSYLARENAEVFLGDLFDNSKRLRSLLDSGWAASDEG